jgi:rhodanese-related sulfurtransferase
MRTAKAVVFEALVVAALGLLFALAANALSPRGLRVTRNYFPEAGTPAAIAPARTNAINAIHAGKAPLPTGVPGAIAQRLQQRGLQLVSSNQVAELFRDPRYEQGLIVFIDARDDAHYAAGHLPGAWQFHHYRADDYLPAVLPACLTAMQVVVYCSGGECEDSEFAALMLRDAGVPRETLFVYAGGFTEWRATGLPVETGARRSGQLLPRTP